MVIGGSQDVSVFTPQVGNVFTLQQDKIDMYKGGLGSPESNLRVLNLIIKLLLKYEWQIVYKPWVAFFQLKSDKSWKV